MPWILASPGYAALIITAIFVHNEEFLPPTLHLCREMIYSTMIYVRLFGTLSYVNCVTAVSQGIYERCQAGSSACYQDSNRTIGCFYVMHIYKLLCNKRLLLNIDAMIIGVTRERQQLQRLIQTKLWYWLNMMSWNGNIFRVTGPLCWEFTGHRWIHITKASGAELSCFLWWVNNRKAGDLRRHRAHYYVTLMSSIYITETGCYHFQLACRLFDPKAITSTWANTDVSSFRTPGTNCKEIIV